MTYLLLILGFGLLIKGASLFVDGSSNIARLLRVSPILIGLTIVALGTSSPEATISIIAAINENEGISIGNVIGSNIFSLTLIVGMTSILHPLKVESETVQKEIPFTLLASVVLLILISDVFLQGFSVNSLTRSDGLIFLLFFLIFLYYVFEMAIKNRKEHKPETVSKDVKWSKNIVISIIGVVAIILGGELVVKSSTKIALSLGMSETLVGLTIIAVGTSLPELVTSITAAIKKETQIALGNIVGSTIFNILFVLGITATISPLAVNEQIITDVVIMIILTTLLLVFSRTKYQVGRTEGIILIATYVIYLTYIILRN